MKIASFLVLMSAAAVVSADDPGDDPNFRYIFENKRGKTFDMGGCEFVAKKPKARCKTKIDGIRVSDACPTACAKQILNMANKNKKKKMRMKMKGGDEDKDDDGFVYFYKNKDGEEVMKEDGCKFVSKKPLKRCGKVVKGDKVSEMCPEACAGYDGDDDDDDDDNFTLLGSRTYIGCSAQFFELDFQCGTFGAGDDDLCVVYGVGVGDVVENEDGDNFIEPYPEYDPNFDAIDGDKVCKVSGTFSRSDRVTDDEILPIPMTVSPGCNLDGQNLVDWQYVMKAKIDRKKNIIHLSFSDDWGATYYTDGVDTPEVYIAIVKEDMQWLEDADEDRRGRRLSHGYSFPSWYYFWLQNYYSRIPGCRGRTPSRPPTPAPTPTTAPVSTRAPEISTSSPGITRKLAGDDNASSKKKTTQKVLI